jgi:hypothetical protein
MDPYTLSLLLGGIGLGAMAVSGLGRQGHSGGARGHGHAHGAGHAHAHGSGHAPTHAAGHAQAHGAAHSHATGTHQTSSASTHAHGVRDFASRSVWALMSPRVLFSVLLGVGTTGLLLRPVLSGPLLATAALAGGVLFERLLVTPIWNFALRFASKPAVTLESSIADEATAVTSFDANGQGIVQIELDGQVIQILGTLLPADRQSGMKVRAGERVRIEDVDTARNRCTVSIR